MRAADEFRTQVAIAIPDAAVIMFIRTVGDEATAFIGAFQILTWFMTKIGMIYISILLALADFLHSVDKLLERFLKSIELWVTFIFCALLIFDLSCRIILKHFVIWDFIVKTGTSAVAHKFSNQLEGYGRHSPDIALFVALPLACLAIGIMASGILPMGFQAILGTLLYEVTVEPVPTGVWQLYQVEPEGRVQGLMHSVSYENRKALLAIGKWMNDRIGEPFIQGLA